MSVFPAFAVNPDEVLNDPVLEARARALSVEIRCLVCQNQSIDDSDAELARELRILVREKLVEGFSDAEVLDFLVARYGEFVLLKPRFNAATAVLWIAPFFLLMLAGTALLVVSRRRKFVSSETALLTDEEQKTLNRLLDKSD
ncbi:MAG: cytochrome c-type biogenesis protein [Pseudomonadota bacterium]